MHSTMSHNRKDAWAFPSPTESAGVTATSLGLLASTGVVVAGYSMGASWLATPVLGLPAGVWAVPAVYGLVRWGMVRPRWVLAQAAAGLNRVLFGGGRLPSLGRKISDLTAWEELTLGVGGAMASLASRAGRPLAGWLSGRTMFRTPDADSLDRSFCQWHDRIAWPVRPLHVAMVGASDRLSRALREATAASGVRWFQGDSRVDDQILCERHGLDGVLSVDADGRAHLATHERPGRDASWYDWGTRCPLSYASVFPGRLDPFLVTLGTVDGADAQALNCVASAACVLARHPGRVGAVDRARGRRPIDLPVGPAHPEAPAHAVASALDSLTRLVSDWPLGRPATGAIRVAARVSSAWLAGGSCALEAEDRIPGLEAAARVLPTEPEALLRLGAVRIAAGRDEEGLEALVEADRLLHESGEVAQVDPFAFLQAELAAGGASPLTLGRVASGICMVCARTPAERLPYLRDDIMDDMRYAEWLVGSDPDRLLLYRVFDEIAGARRVRESTPSLFAAAA